MKRRANKIRENNLGLGVKINVAQIGRYNNQFFCTGDNKNNIQIWSFEDENPVQTLLPSLNQASQTEVSALTFTNQENGIVSGSNRGIINIWDLETAKISCTLKGHSAPVNTFTTFPGDDGRLASGSYDTNIKLWDLRERDSKVTLKGHTKPVNSLDISPDEKLLVSGSEDGSVKLWDIRMHEKLITTYVEHTGPINCVKFNPEDIMFASAGADKTAKYFQCEPGKYIYISSTNIHSSPINAIEFSHDGKLLYTACNDSLKVWIMGKDGMLVDNIDCSWKGVLDLCLIDETLIGVAFANGLLSFWAYETDGRTYDLDEEPKSHREEREGFFIKQNISEDLRDVMKNVGKAVNKINSVEKKEQFKKNLSANDESAKEPKKRNFLEDLQRKKEQELRMREQQRIEREEASRKEQRRREEERVRRQNAEKLAKQRMMQEQREAKKRENQRSQEEIAKIGLEMAKQQQSKMEAHSMMESVLYDQQLDATLNASQFIDARDKQNHKQIDMINEILKQSVNFGRILNQRQTSVKPIIKWWMANNIKNALFALKEAAAVVVIDFMTAVLNNGKMKSQITTEVAIALCSKCSELILEQRSHNVRAGIIATNGLVCLFKEDLIRIKNFNPGTRVDLTRQQRIKKYDLLIEQFLKVFKMDRVVKYANSPSSELHQHMFILYKNLQQILRKWTPKSESEAVC